MPWHILMSFGALPVLGMLLFASLEAAAFSIACPTKPGLECVGTMHPDGKGQSCQCRYTDPAVRDEDFRKNQEIARKQEAEHLRKGGKPDREKVSNKIWPSWLPKPANVE